MAITWSMRDRCSVQHAVAAAVVQHEGRDLDFEAPGVLGHAEVAAMHAAAGRAEATAAGVLERLARLEQGLLADHAEALDLLGLAEFVGDDPVPGDQLRRHL